jgi:hypothetical protein
MILLNLRTMVVLPKTKGRIKDVTIAEDMVYETGGVIHYQQVPEVEFTTADAGITIAIDDLTRARNRIQDTQLRLQQRTIANSVGSAGDTDGMIAVDDNYLYVCTGNHDGSTAIWKRVTLGATF